MISYEVSVRTAWSGTVFSARCSGAALASVLACAAVELEAFDRTSVPPGVRIEVEVKVLS